MTEPPLILAADARVAEAAAGDLGADGWRVVCDTAAARLYEDLKRIGPVEVRHRAAPGPALTDQQRRLLELVAGGATLEEAARTVHLSRRTAIRRLAEARRILGVVTTAHAAALLPGRDRPQR